MGTSGGSLTQVECINCSDGSDLGLALAVVAVAISVIALAVAIFQTKLATTQTRLAKAQTDLSSQQMVQSDRQMKMAEKEHAVFLAELERKPIVTVDVCLRPEFTDGLVEKPPHEPWEGLLEIRFDNDGTASAKGMLVNLTAPAHLEEFVWVRADGSPDADGEPPAPLPRGAIPLADAYGQAVEAQYLDQKVDLMKRSVTCLWAKVIIQPGVTSIPFSVRASHEQIERLVSADFMIRVSPSLTRG